jgi:hypothetical protein
MSDLVERINVADRRRVPRDGAPVSDLVERINVADRRPVSWVGRR